MVNVYQLQSDRGKLRYITKDFIVTIECMKTQTDGMNSLMAMISFSIFYLQCGSHPEGVTGVSGFIGPALKPSLLSTNAPPLELSETLRSKTSL